MVTTRENGSNSSKKIDNHKNPKNKSACNNKDRLAKKRDAERKRRERIKKDPVKWQEMQQKEREKYLLKKENRQIKNVATMSTIEVCSFRKKNRARVAAYRKRQQEKSNLLKTQACISNDHGVSQNDSYF